jgi:NADH dehydrogenase/NADH:ubiquinone oxidoreductase subunit G
MMDHITTTYRTAATERRFLSWFLRGFCETFAGLLIPACPFAALQDSTSATVAMTWTLNHGNAPPDPGPVRLT